VERKILVRNSERLQGPGMDRKNVQNSEPLGVWNSANHISSTSLNNRLPRARGTFQFVTHPRVVHLSRTNTRSRFACQLPAFPAKVQSLLPAAWLPIPRSAPLPSPQWFRANKVCWASWLWICMEP